MKMTTFKYVVTPLLQKNYIPYTLCAINDGAFALARSKLRVRAMRVFFFCYGYSLDPLVPGHERSFCVLNISTRATRHTAARRDATRRRAHRARVTRARERARTHARARECERAQAAHHTPRTVRAAHTRDEALDRIVVIGAPSHFKGR